MPILQTPPQLQHPPRRGDVHHRTARTTVIDGRLLFPLVVIKREESVIGEEVAEVAEYQGGGFYIDRRLDRGWGAGRCGGLGWRLGGGSCAIGATEVSDTGVRCCSTAGGRRWGGEHVLECLTV